MKETLQFITIAYSAIFLMDRNWKLGEELEKIECVLNPEYFAQKARNVILEQWNSLPQKFSVMKVLAPSLFTFFKSTYACKQLFSTKKNFIKSKRKKLSCSNLYVIKDNKLWTNINFLESKNSNKCHSNIFLYYYNNQHHPSGLSYLTMTLALKKKFVQLIMFIKHFCIPLLKYILI